MPTGYTALIHDKEDVTVKDYLRRCASGFGFAGTRDSGFEPRPPSAPPLRLYAELDTAKRELEEFRSKSDEELRVEYEASMKGREERNERNKAVFEARQSRFLRIKAGLDAWDPPEELESLKGFALRQLEVDSTAWQGEAFRYEFPSFEKWKANQEEALTRKLGWRQDDVDKAEKQYKENKQIWQVFVREIGTE